MKAVNGPTLADPIGANIRMRQIPANHNVTGTCGKCGGPVLQHQIWAGMNPPPEYCMDCNAVPRDIIAPSYGPIRPMKDS